MKKFAVCLVLFLIAASLSVFIAGCGEKEKTQNELALGNWTQLRNRAYILLVNSPKGEWTSSVRIAGVGSKIVKSKGTAKGMWYIEDGQMIFTVTESDIEEIWEKNATLFFNIVELTEGAMRLEDESGRVFVWNKTISQKTAASENDPAPVLSLEPVVVNLNKNRSNDKDRYLCLNLNLVLKELMPDQEIPPIHPRAREAVILFLSSLVFNDVKDFDSIKDQNKKLVDVLNPYMEGFIKEIEVEHVMVVSEIDKVEEFVIEHSLTEEPVPEEGEGAEGTEESKEKQD